MLFTAHSGVRSSKLVSLQAALSQERALPYSTPYASLSLPYDTQWPLIPSDIMDTDILVLIGIGGSNLGTLAILDALRTRKTPAKEIISLDTVDTYDIANVEQYLSKSLREWKKIVLAALSKSGRTAETIGIFEYFFTKYQSSYPGQVYPVTISDPGSALDTLAIDKWWIHYNLPKNVGGRYSVLSHVGLFPLIWMWVDIDSIQAWARSSIEDYKKSEHDHPSTIVAETLAVRSSQWRNIFEHFYFAKHLENVGKWYRQLLAESVGKIRKDGKSVGITPTTSIGTTDLHSVAQLDLAHVSDRTLAIVSLTDVPSSTIPDAPFAALVDDIRGRSFADIMEWARYGLTSSLDTKDISYFEYSLKADNPYDLGYFLQTKMIEVILLGLILEVDPFDQPNVEDYKSGMREYLKK